MAQPTNTFDSVDAIGIREDLSDVIYNISPTDTPFFSMIGRATAKADQHEWQTDSLAADAHNAVISGDDATLDAVTPTNRIYNRNQILDKTAVIAGNVESMVRAGRGQEMAYQVAKKTRELKRDLEGALTGGYLPTNGAMTVGTATIAATMGCLPAWLHTNVSREDTTGAGANAGSFTGGQLLPTEAPTDSTVTRALTETLLKTVIQGCWTNGGDPDCIMVGPHNKTVISGFTANSAVTRFAMTDGAKLVTALDIYVSDFGEHKIVPNRFQRDRDAFVLDSEYWAVAYLRTPRNWKLAKTGDSEKRQILTECTLEARQEASSGVVADLATS